MLRKGARNIYIATLTFKTTNNEVEYEALSAELSITKTLRAEEIEVIETYTTKGEKLKLYLN